MTSKKIISLSLLLLLGNSYLSAMESLKQLKQSIFNYLRTGELSYNQSYNKNKTQQMEPTFKQQRAMDFFENIYTKITNDRTILFSGDFNFLSDTTVEIRSEKNKNVVIITKNEKNHKNPFSIQHKKNELTYNVPKNEIQNYGKIYNNFNALQTLNKIQQ